MLICELKRCCSLDFVFVQRQASYYPTVSNLYGSSFLFTVPTWWHGFNLRISQDVRLFCNISALSANVNAVHYSVAYIIIKMLIVLLQLIKMICNKSWGTAVLNVLLFTFRWFSGARWHWWWFATRLSARRFMSHTKLQRAVLTQPVAERKPKCLWWWGCFSSASPPFISPAFPILWPRPAAAQVIARHRTHSTLLRKPPCGCLPLTYVWTRSSTCFCVRCFGKNWQPHSAASHARKVPWTLPRQRQLTWRCHR